MQQLVKIEVKDGQQLISGRELWEKLEIKTEYMKWISRMIEYGFDENVDFSVIVKNDDDETSFGGLRKVTEHILTIPMAKELCMIQRTDIGKELRKYFIKCEEAWNDEDMILARANQIQSRMIEGHIEKIKTLEIKIEKDAPKVLFADTVASSQTSTLVGNVAKLITQGGKKMGQNKFFEWLRENGYLIKRKGDSYNMPTQKSMELGLFEIKERTGVNPDGSVRISKTPMVTGKGQQYFVNIHLNCEVVGV